MNEKDMKSLIEQVILDVMNEKTSPKQTAAAAPAARSVGRACGVTPEAGETASGIKQGGTVIEDEIIPDIREWDYTKCLDVENAENPEEYLRIKAKTDARLGAGRCGPRYTTRTMLRMLADHAGAIDAVESDTKPEVLERNNLFTVSTVCRDKDEYMARPDLGRLFSKEAEETIKSKCRMHPDVQVIVADGLSSTAVTMNIDDLLPSLEQGFKVEGITSGTPFFVKYGRVPAMDPITEYVGSKVTVMLVGERPGLATYSSLSAYITYGGYVGMPEAGRTVVSNIHKNGANPVEAGAHIASVVRKMLDQKASGTDLKL